MRPRTVVVAGACLLLVQCKDADRVTAPEGMPPVTPAATISDGAHGGTPHFYFLPPIAPGPTVTHTFDAEQSPVVTICELSGSACASTIATFTMTTGPGSETVRLTGEHYHVNWHTGRFDLSADRFYRISVSVDGAELGFVDVDVVSSGKGKKEVDTDEYVAVKNGRTLPIKFRIELERLQGDQDAPAAGAMTRQEFEVRADDYSDTHPDFPGMFFSFRTLLLVFDVETTVGEANEVLDLIEARIAGSIPGVAGEAAGILFLRVPTSSHEEMEDLLELLEGNPHVQHAVQDVLLEGDVVPDVSDRADWTWEMDPSGGNWGMEISRVPQMWNLTDAVIKSAPVYPWTVVFDLGFAERHDDLDYLPNGPVHDHGTHVTGIIGALHDNDTGVNGVNPFAKGTALRAEARIPRSWAWLKDRYERYVDSYPRLRVVNISMGLKWSQRKPPVNPNTDPKAQRKVRGWALDFLALHLLLDARGTSLPVVVVSAGNDSDGNQVEARWNSPMAYAALEWELANVIVVESICVPGLFVDAWCPEAGATPRRSLFSNVNGHISAPGSRILSTIVGGYKYKSGTSMATPHVAGLVGYLYALDPSLPRPTIRTNEILYLLLWSSVFDVPDASPRIDAWATALNIDVIRPGNRVLRMLLDVDDGTPDGNLRVDLRDDTENIRLDNDGDGIGDGLIDMSDFRRWRDWLLQAEDEMCGACLAPQLNGRADHPKKDLNGDGQVNEENVYPRGDFNGDGRISQDEKSLVPGAVGKEATDLEVLQFLFSDPNYDASDLDDLIYSGDLEIDATQCLAQPGVASVDSEIRLTGGSLSPIEGRNHDWVSESHVYTATEGEYTARVQGLDANGKVVACDEEHFSLVLGGDELWEPQCDAECGGIAFFYPELGLGTTIWTMNADGSGAMQINRRPAFVGVNALASSPDGRRLAFGSASPRSVVVMNSDGSEARDLGLSSLAGHPLAWSPSGTMLAIGASSWLCPLVVLDATDGSTISQLNWCSPWGRGFSWAPRQSITIVSGEYGPAAVYTVDLDGSWVRYGAPGIEVMRYPRWSPDLSRLLFVSGGGIEGGLYEGLPWCPPESPFYCGLEVRQLLDYSANSLFITSAPSYSPDGSKIVFGCHDYPYSVVDYGICVVNADGTDLRRLDPGAGSELNPVWIVR